MCWNLRNTSALVWLGLGLLAGLLVSGFWPSVPMHASATDKVESFSMATGAVEPEYEAVYFLDHLTGDLRAFVISRSAASPNGFGVIEFCSRNILADFKDENDKGDEKAPKFMMVTGLTDLNRTGRGGNILPSRAIVYVADVTSGIANAYAVPFNTTQHMTGQYFEMPLARICYFPIRKIMGAPRGKKGKAAPVE